MAACRNAPWNIWKKREAERFDPYAWRAKMIKEHDAAFESYGYFNRPPEQRPALQTG